MEIREKGARWEQDTVEPTHFNEIQTSLFHTEVGLEQDSKVWPKYNISHYVLVTLKFDLAVQQTKLKTLDLLFTLIFVVNSTSKYPM
jgi:hypothetical protein